jgi:hypothetical protein
MWPLVISPAATTRMVHPTLVRFAIQVDMLYQRTTQT